MHAFVLVNVLGVRPSGLPTQICISGYLFSKCGLQSSMQSLIINVYLRLLLLPAWLRMLKSQGTRRLCHHIKRTTQKGELIDHLCISRCRAPGDCHSSRLAPEKPGTDAKDVRWPCVCVADKVSRRNTGLSPDSIPFEMAPNRIDVHRHFVPEIYKEGR